MDLNHKPSDMLSDALPIELPWPAGFELVENFLSREEEKELLAQIDAQGTWEGDGQKFRRVQQYGATYDYQKHNVVDTSAHKPIPEFLRPIIEKLPGPIHQAFINEYIHHQGIGPHIDPPDTFGPVIWGLSLGSPAVLRFTRPGFPFVDVELPPRSLLQMSGDSRYLWKHEIPYSRSVPGFPRRNKHFRRVSITFRSLLTTEP